MESDVEIDTEMLCNTSEGGVNIAPHPHPTPVTLWETTSERVYPHYSAARVQWVIIVLYNVITSI